MSQASPTVADAVGPSRRRSAARVAIAVLGLVAGCGLVWWAVGVGGAQVPAPAAGSSLAAILNVAVLVFREGLECVLVLAAITAGKSEEQDRSRRPIATGVVVAAAATLVTWHVAVRVIADLGANFSALQVQAITGMLAIVVLLLVMNWFFHRLYWTGWISLHTERKRRLLWGGEGSRVRSRQMWGLGLLGFSSLYREGFEVVLFLQSYRLRLGGEVVGWGALIGILLSGIVALFTFVVHRRLPYRRMLVATGVTLGVVLFVMVGEQAQEMQLAHWLPTTTIAVLAHRIPAWMGVWFSLFPTVESLAAQALVILLVLGSYRVARRA